MTIFYTRDRDAVPEMYKAAQQILGQPTYSWYGPTPPEYEDNRETILPVSIARVSERTDRRGNITRDLILNVHERDGFDSHEWVPYTTTWSMRAWGFQTIANYDEENDL